VINWWIGRLSDQELGEYAALPPRAVGLVLELPYMRAQITGGGRGSRHSRRVSPQARNGVGLIAPMRAAGITLELAVNILGAVPYLASTLNATIDYQDTSRGLRSLLSVDPNGGWLPTDVVPWHVWERYVIPCRRVDILEPHWSQIGYFDLHSIQHFKCKTRFLVRKMDDSQEIEMVPMFDKPVYAGEIDHSMAYDYWNIYRLHSSDSDNYLLIVDGKWIFYKYPKLPPLEAMEERLHEQNHHELAFHVDPIAVVEDDRKTVRAITKTKDESLCKEALNRLDYFNSLLNINITLALRKMKRRALGLPVDSAPTATFAERYAMASRYPPPVSLFLPPPLAEKWKPEKDD
jgi:hypothetical protein